MKSSYVKLDICIEVMNWFFYYSIYITLLLFSQILCGPSGSIKFVSNSHGMCTMKQRKTYNCTHKKHQAAFSSWQCDTRPLFFFLF